MYNEEDVDQQVAIAARYAIRHAALNVLKTEFFPSPSEKERHLERWMKISLANLSDRFYEAMVTPLLAFNSDAKAILGKKHTHAAQQLIDILTSSQNLKKISSEKRLTKQNSLILQHIKRYNTKNSREKLTEIYPELSERRIVALTTLYEEELLKKLKHTTEKMSTFILDCKSLGISEKKINATSVEYDELLSAEFEKIMQKMINIVLSGEELGKLPELPEIPAKPASPKVIDHNGCCSSMLFSFPWQSKPFAMNAIPNNMLDEENKEDIKFNHIP